MGTLAFVFSSGWGSGLNCYLVVLVLGIADRVHDTSQVPDVLQRWDVLGVAAFLYAAVGAAARVVCLRPRSSAVWGTRPLEGRPP